MGALFAAISIGAVGLAAAIIGMFALLSFANPAKRRAKNLQQTDPQLAAELRKVEADINRGRIHNTF